MDLSKRSVHNILLECHETDAFEMNKKDMFFCKETKEKNITCFKNCSSRITSLIAEHHNLSI